MIDIKLYPAKSEKTRWIERKQGIIVLNPKTGIYHKLNQTAADIWQLCNGINSIEKISGLLTNKYKLTSKQAEKDVYLLIHSLKKSGLIGLFRSPERFQIKNA